MEMVDQELILDFIVESQEGLANVENQMLAIEAAGANIDTHLVNAVFRTMHSIKGTAGFLGLARIETLAHGLEEVLNNLRNREVNPTSELVSTVLRATDFMNRLMDAVETSNESDVAPFVAQLQKFRPGASEHSHHEIPASVQSSNSTTDSRPAASAAMGEAVREFLLECSENFDQMERELVSLEVTPSSEPLLRSIFRTIHTVKGGAGFLALGSIEKLAHVAENLLGQLRSGERTLNPETISALLATVDKCRESLRFVETTGNDAAFDPQAVITQ
jgi:two-component system, chemotaxis family, sensor kinase CheA